MRTSVFLPGRTPGERFILENVPGIELSDLENFKEHRSNCRICLNVQPATALGDWVKPEYYWKVCKEGRSHILPHPWPPPHWLIKNKVSDQEFPGYQANGWKFLKVVEDGLEPKSQDSPSNGVPHPPARSAPPVAHVSSGERTNGDTKDDREEGKQAILDELPRCRHTMRHISELMNVSLEWVRLLSKNEFGVEEHQKHLGVKKCCQP
jgi:hypothetical protein